MTDLEEYLAIYSKCESSNHQACKDCGKCILFERTGFVDNFAQVAIRLSKCDLLFELEEGGRGI